MPTDALISLPGFSLLGANLENNRWHASLTSTGSSCRCPECGSKSSSVHSNYTRTVSDLPVSGKAIILELHVRRFRCRDSNCSRRVFCEQFDDPRRYAQRTERQRVTMSNLCVELGSRAGTRASSKLEIVAGRTTVLNAIRSTPLPDPGTPSSCW